MPQPVMKEGVFCHIEIPTADHQKAQAFYGGVFGWKFQHHPEMNYTIFETRPGGIGGGIWVPTEGMAKQVINYILVDEIEPVADRVREHGGTVVKEKMEVPGAGWLALVTDTDGNLFGLWKSAHPFPPEDPDFRKKAPTKRKAKPAARKAKAKPAARKAKAKPAPKKAKARPAAKKAKAAAKKVKAKASKRR